MANLQLALAAICLAASGSYAALPTLSSGTQDNFIGILMSSDIQVKTPPQPTTYTQV